MNHIAKKEMLDKLSIYIPDTKIDQRPVERLKALGEKRERPVSAPLKLVQPQSLYMHIQTRTQEEAEDGSSQEPNRVCEPT